jgi:hypothetical protein
MDPWLEGITRSLVAKAIWEVGEAYFERRPDAVEAGVEAAMRRSSQTIIDTHRPATIYWLGNDLMNIETHALLFKSPMTTRDLLESALEYIHSLGFADDEVPVTKLNELLQRVEGAIEGLFDADEVVLDRVTSLYTDLLAVVEEVKWYVHSVLELHEDGFEKERVFLD